MTAKVDTAAAPRPSARGLDGSPRERSLSTIVWTLKAGKFVALSAQAWRASSRYGRT